jgi:hypothetical protein
LQGAPVRKGDPLFRLAQLDTLYIEMEVDEKDIHDVALKANSEITFLAQPHLSYPITIDTIKPVAEATESGNVVRIRASLIHPPAPWFRPGMSGAVRIETEKRSLIWVLMHRTIDTLRMVFWW